MGKKIRPSPSREGVRQRKRRKPFDPKHIKGLEPLSNIPLPADREESEFNEEELSEQDFEFVEQHLGKLTFLEKIEKDELDQQVIDKQRTEMEKRQQKIERVQKKAKQSKASRFDEDVTESEGELDVLDEEHAKKRIEAPRKNEASTSTHGLHNRLPLKTPDGRVVFEQEMNAAAADCARRVEGVTVDDVFVEEIEKEEEETDADSERVYDMDTRVRDFPEAAAESETELSEIKSEDDQIPDGGRDELKTQIAVQSNKMLSQAEKSVIPLKKLLILCSNRDPQIQRLAMVSSMQVFKDIIPAYRITTKMTISQEQTKKKMDREQLKTKEYESLLLQCYQSFLKMLLSNAESFREGNRSSSTRRICIKCLCGLAKSLHHFNYGTDLIKAVVNNVKRSDKTMTSICCSTLADIIQSDVHGHRTLDIVQFVGDLIKRQKCCVDPQLVECLFHVSFSDLPTPSKEDRKEKKVSKHRRRKMFKIRNQLEKRGEDYEVDNLLRDKGTEEKAQLQSQTVEALFEIFFRVLKHCSHQVHSRSCYENEHSVHRYISLKCPLLAVCLRGLAKYAHIMSIEYFEDLLAVMTKLLNCAALPFYERFQCLFTVSCIFRGQGEALNIDRKDIFRQLYEALGNWRPDAVQGNDVDRNGNEIAALPLCLSDSGKEIHNPGVILIQVCHQMLCETKTSDFGKLAAFIKRMLSVAIHQETGVAMGMSSIVHKLLMKYRRLRTLMEGESETPIKDAIYDPSVADPSQAGGLLTSLWELTLLQTHYHPDTAQGAKQMLKIQPDAMNSESGCMATVLTSTDGPPGLTARYTTLQGGFCPAPYLRNQPKRQKRQRKSPIFAELLNSGDQKEDSQEIGTAFEHYFCNRKKPNRSRQVHNAGGFAKPLSIRKDS